MGRLIYLFGLIMFLTSCNKDDEPKFINETSDEIVKYLINMTGTKISDYSKYLNNELIEKIAFYETDTVIEQITKNTLNEITYKKTYLIGDNDLAFSCIDSSFSDYGLYVARLDYDYENDYLITTTIDWKRFGENADSGQVTISRIIENENISSLNESFTDWTSGCTDYYDYNNDINKIDIRNFTNEVTGKISKNLIKHASWNNGCPCGPSSSIAYSDFNYELDNNGFVTKMTETYTPCYHLTTAEEVTRLIRMTIYEYNAR